MNQQFLFDLLLIASIECVGDQFIIGWDNSAAGLNLRYQLIILRMDQRKFELRYSRELVARFLDFRRIEAGNLDENTVGIRRRDDRLANAELVDALANDLHRLVDHRLGDLFFATDKPNQERRAPLQVQTQPDFLLQGLQRQQAHDCDRNRKHRSEHPFPKCVVGAEIPP